MFVAMTTNNYLPESIDFIVVDLKNPRSLSQLLSENSNSSKRVWLSSVLNIPPKKINRHYNAIAVFTIPKAELESKITFLIAGRDETRKTIHGMPNVFVGNTDPADKSLLELY